MQTHGARAASIAIKRAAYLHQCGEEEAAHKWRQIAAAVRAMEAEKTSTPETATVSR